MKLTIIPSDKVVVIDYKGISFGLDNAAIPQNIHALQWDSSSGHIEYTDSDNIAISELPEWANTCVTLWNEQEAILSAPVIKTENDIEKEAREHRSALMFDTDWWATSDRTMSAEQTAYRQALRDITLQAGFPNEVIWPTKPE